MSIYIWFWGNLTFMKMSKIIWTMAKKRVFFWGGVPFYGYEKPKLTQTYQTCLEYSNFRVMADEVNFMYVNNL